MQWLLYGEIISILSLIRLYSGNGDDQCVQVCEAEQKLWVGPATDSTPGKKNGSGSMSSSEHNVTTAPAPSVSGKNGLAPTPPTPVPAMPPAPVSGSGCVALS